MLLQKLSFLDQDWNSVIVVLLFNLFDTLGKYIPTNQRINSKTSILIGIYVIRLGLLVVFILAGNGAEELRMDWLYFGSIVVYGFSNGLFMNILMLGASGSV